MTENSKMIVVERSFLQCLLDCLSYQMMTCDMDKESIAQNEIDVKKLIKRGSFLLCFDKMKENLKRDLIEKATEKWNGDLDRIRATIQEQEDGGWDERHPRTPLTFSWPQFVCQEIWMWCAMSVDACLNAYDDAIYPGPISVADFETTCERRGFEDPQKNYLIEMLNYLEIGIEDEPPAPPAESGDMVLDLNAEKEQENTDSV